MRNERCARIRKAELLYDEVKRAAGNLDGALDAFAASGDKIRALEEYLSGEWRDDFESDERGELPARLKRGVLSEDALYDLLADCDRLSKILNAARENEALEP